jgi:GntR family transcriptional regulator
MFEVDEHSPMPIYAQLAGQIRDAIVRGALAPGAQLPTIRELGVRLRINPNTVARVYADLEREGVIATFRGRGTFVKDAPAPPPPEERRRRLEGIIQTALAEAARLGVQPEAFARQVQEAVRRGSGG